MQFHEAHLEHLLGRRVCDANGVMLGRIEELRVEVVDGETVVTEYHIGAAAVLERLGAAITQLPFFRYIPFARKGYCVAWAQLDLSDPRRPRALVPRTELREIRLQESRTAS